MSSTETQVSYYGKDTNDNTFGISFKFSIVDAYDAKLVSDKNERIRTSDPYHVKNGEYACKAGAFGVVIYDINLDHDKIKKEDLRIKMRFKMNKQTDENGRSWIMKKGSTYAYDQNPGDEYQFAITKAEKYGVKLSEEQIAMGVEQTTEDTGIFMIISSLCYVVEEKPVAQTRGMTRGGPTRYLRGSAEDDDDFLNGYSLGRIGNGSKATTNTTTVDVKEITNSDYKTQVRLYVDDSSSTDIVVKFGQTREELKASSVLPPFRG
jgi:hypothetical protein